MLCAATSLGVALLVGGCSAGPVEIKSPNGLPDADQQACEAFIADLPPTLAEEMPREIDPADALGAAYGDPAITVTCGVPVPAGFDRTSSCEVANGVGWYVPPEQFDNQNADVTMSAAGYRPVVQIRVPHDYRPNGQAAAIAELAKAVETHLSLLENCD